MAEDGEVTEDERHEDRIRTGSDELTEGVSKTVTSFSRILLGVWQRFEGHPAIRFLIVAAVSTVVGGTVVRTLGALYGYFFDQTVTVSRDVAIDTFPLPLGLSVWLLSIALLTVGLLGYFRVVALRQRVEELEARLEG